MAASTQLAAIDDSQRSPLTGYTRDHWLEILERLVAGVVPYIDRQTGVPHLVGDPRDHGLGDQLRAPGGLDEAYDRIFLLIAIYMAATGRTAIVAGDSAAGVGSVGHEVVLPDLLRRGLRTLRDPASPQYNPRAGLFASLLGMCLAPQHLLDPLDAAERKLLVDSLQKLVHRPSRDSNHRLFSMMPACLLDRLGVDYDRPLLDGYFDEILSMYRGDGWFIDGWNRGFDHYNFWGFQLYLHALVTYDSKWRDRYAERVREITRRHEETLPFYFGRDGGPIPKGRSLNYRFGVLSGLGYAQLSGLSSLEPGLARRISSGCLKYFWDRGCQSERGLLEPGFHGPNGAIGEDYTDRGAPYWAATGLVAATLPATHPFWTATEQPMPADSPGVKRCLIRGAQMVLKVDGRCGEARMMTAGEPFFHRHVWQAGTKYFQHSYSSTLGHALAGDQGPELAAGRTGLSADGERWSYRTWPRVVAMTERWARTEWDAWAGLEGLTGTVVTISFFLDQGEVHVFWHTDPEPRYLTIGGYAVQLGHGEKLNETRPEDFGPLLPDEEPSDPFLWLMSHQMSSSMKITHGPDGELTSESVLPRPGFLHSHIFGGWAAYPRWTSREAVAAGVKVVVVVDAMAWQGDLGCEHPQVAVRQQGSALIISTADGEFTIE